jgi:predicted nucleotidyltransferase
MESSLSQAQIDAILSEVETDFPRVEGVYLYGSAASGTRGRQSDIDVALLLPVVEAKTVGPLGMSKLRFRLEKILGCAVDLVNARLAPVVLQKEIVASGVPVFVRDRARLDGYEMLVLSLYGKLNEERKGILEEFAATGKAYQA